MKKVKKLLTALLTLSIGVTSMFALGACDETYTTQETDALVSQLQTTIASNKAELDEKMATLTEEYKAKDVELLAAIEANETALSVLQTAYEAKVAEFTQAGQANAQAIATLTTEYNAKVEELEDEIAEINATIASNKTELEAAIATLQATYDKKVENLEELIVVIQNTDSTQNEKIAELEKQVEELLKVHTHEWGEEIMLQEATCEKKGFTVQYCKTCGEDKLTVVENNKEHEWYYEIVLSQATCTSRGCSMSICKNCSATKTEVVDEKHSYDKYGLCVKCDMVSSRGLTFVLNDDESSYTITGIGTCTSTSICIPSKIYGKPVTVIADNAFRNCTTLKSVAISKNIIKIGENAFYNCSNLDEVEYEGTKSDWDKIEIAEGNESLKIKGSEGWTGIF